MNSPLLTVVVTTKNEEKNISNCLRSIFNQDYNNLEVIVVDNNSTDNTKNLSLEMGAKVFNHGPERSAQRNLGLLRESHGSYLIYIDADMILTDKLIQHCVKQIESRNLGALYIPEVILGKSLFARVRRFERQFYSGTSIDATRFFRREVILKVKGFDEELFKSGSGEDWDLDKKIRLVTKVGILQNSDKLNEIDSWTLEMCAKNGVLLEGGWQGILHDEREDKLFEYLRKKRYYSEGFAGYIMKWGKDDRDVMEQFGWKFRFFKVFFHQGNWKITIMHFHYYIFTIFLKILVGFFTYSNWNYHSRKNGRSV